MLVIAFEHKWILFKNLCYGLMLFRYMKRYEPNCSLLLFVCRRCFLDGCYVIGVIVINKVEAHVLFTLRHDCVTLLCEARGLKSVQARLCGGTCILRGACVQHQSCTGDHACRTRRDTMGFMREARVCST